MEISSWNEMKDEQEVVYSWCLGMCPGAHVTTGYVCVPSQSSPSEIWEMYLLFVSFITYLYHGAEGKVLWTLKVKCSFKEMMCLWWGLWGSASLLGHLLPWLYAPLLFKLIGILRSINTI